MKINVDRLLLNPFKDGDEGGALQENGKDITLRSILVAALLNANPSANTGKHKADRYGLALRIQQAEQEVEIEVEEAALLKELVGLGYGPIIVGQVYEILEGNENVE